MTISDTQTWGSFAGRRCDVIFFSARGIKVSKADAMKKSGEKKERLYSCGKGYILSQMHNLFVEDFLVPCV